jgi:predicted permease
MVSWKARWLDALRMRVRSAARRRRAEEELDEELRFHLDSVTAGYVAQGMPPEAARRKARLEMGGVDRVKEECREARGLTPVENLLRDLAYAWRGLRKAPGFTLTAAGAIALGVGANAALFTILYGMALRPLPVKDPGTVRNVFMETQGTGPRGQYGSRYFVSYEEFTFLRDHARTAELAAVAEQKLSWKGARGGPVYAQLVSANLLPLIGARPVLGRFFTAAETARPGTAPVAVLSYAAWQKYFGGAADAAGRTMVLNRTPFTVIGVADAATSGPLITKPDLWVPYTMQAVLRPSEGLIGDANVGWLQTVARRKPDATDAQMQAEMQVLGPQSVAAHGSARRARVTVAPGAFLNSPEIMSRGMVVGAVLLLAVSLVLLVACSNVANMLLARGLSRRREFAIRLSIGAGKGRLLQQLLSESLLLAALGGALGLALAQAATRVMVAAVPADAGPLQLELSPDWRILLYTLAVSLGAGLLFGLFPALNLLRSNLTPALKSDGLEAASRRRHFRIQDALIAVQVAACLVLLVNAGLLLRAFRTALRMDTGQTVRNVLIASFDLRQQQYTDERAERFASDLREAAAALPGVRAASLTAIDPFLSTCITGARVVAADGTAGQEFQALCEQVGLDYFRTTHIALLEGRAFQTADFRSHAKVAIVDERLARRYYAGTNPLGRRIRLGDKPEDDREIVGVAAATRALGLDSTDDPKVYEPLSGTRAGDAILLVNYDGPREALMRAVEKSVADLDPDVTANVKPIEQNVNEALMPQKLGAAAASTLGGLGLLLACTGVYGVVAFAVGRRRREVGIRMALGAGRRDVLGLLLWQVVKPVAAGTLAGLALAAAAAQLIRTMLYGVSPLDPPALAATAAILALAAAPAALIPARAALRVDPAVTLRHD